MTPVRQKYAHCWSIWGIESRVSKSRHRFQSRRGLSVAIRAVPRSFTQSIRLRFLTRVTDWCSLFVRPHEKGVGSGHSIQNRVSHSFRQIWLTHESHTFSPSKTQKIRSSQSTAEIGANDLALHGYTRSYRLKIMMARIEGRSGGYRICNAAQTLFDWKTGNGIGDVSFGTMVFSLILLEM